VECRVADGYLSGRHLLILRDVTQRKASDEQFRQFQRLAAIGQLAGGVAHDVTNLLTVILAWAEFLRAQATLGPEAEAMVGEIHRAADHAAAWTRQMVAFSRRPVTVAVDVNTVVLEVCGMLRRLISGNIDLHISLEVNPWLVTAVPGHLRQVVLNLVVNAREAMPLGGKLTLVTRNVQRDEGCRRHGGEPGEYVLLEVSDSGCGMDAATRARLFEPFFTTKGPGQGTGLGLATVLGVVKQSGGHIEMDSEVGRGSTFGVYLPRQQQPSGPPEGPAAVEAS
jgi:signal transduction histidine kinase